MDFQIGLLSGAGVIMERISASAGLRCLFSEGYRIGIFQYVV